MQKSNWHITGGCRNLSLAFKQEAVQFLMAKKPCRKLFTTGSSSCYSNMNCKLQTWLQDCGHVTSSGLLFAINHEKPDAKSLQ